MKHWKWILATAALMIGITGGAFAEDQRWVGRRDTNAAYAQRYERNRNYNRNYSRNDSYRDGDRDDQGYWRQRRARDNRDQVQSRRDRHDRGRDRD
jgi:hypothetical protein